jgi:hypothetical protein
MRKHVLGIFEKIENAASAARPLEKESVEKEDIELLTGCQYPDGAVISEEWDVPLWKFAIVGGLLGLMAGVFLAGTTQLWMNLDVGGKAMAALPPIGVICYETTLLGVILGSLTGLFWFAGLPDWTDLPYDEEISRGKIGLLVTCSDERQAELIRKIMIESGAHKVTLTEEGG